MNYRFFIIVGVIGLAFNELFISDAFAYLDPGTGSALLQGIIGALVAVGITLKVYWTKIKYAILERKTKAETDN